ncbi:MAG: hypothetical protein M1450_01615 [Patescibacteria group bacterium]|nr:hypothetical protein [Patescibacteria group bacterium]
MGKEIFSGEISRANVGYGSSEEAIGLSSKVNKHPEIREKFFEIAARNIRTYESETLEDNVVSYYPCFVHTVNGRTKLFSAEIPHEEFLIESQIDFLERDGSVKKGFNLLQEKIGQTPGRKFFLWISPRGSAGTKGIYKDINYGYHQIYLGQIDGRKVESYALKSNVNETLLADWINQLTKGEAGITGQNSDEFLFNPVVTSLPAGFDGIELSLLWLKQILEEKGAGNIYKSVPIKGLADRIRQEKTKQEKDTHRIAERLGRSMAYDRYLGVEEARRAVERELYVLYDKYANERGEVTLKGCKGGNITIRSRYGFEAELPTMENILNIFSSKFRIDTNGEQVKFECPNCGYEKKGELKSDTCPQCKITAGEWAAKGNAICLN